MTVSRSRFALVWSREIVLVAPSRVFFNRNKLRSPFPRFKFGSRTNSKCYFVVGQKLLRLHKDIIFYLKFKIAKFES